MRASPWRTLVFKNRGAILVPVAIALLVLGKPTAASAAAGIIAAAGGELLRIWAVGYSGVTTRADAVTAPQLVTAGPYALVRNPLYVGNAIIALGFWWAFTGSSAIGMRLALLACVLVFVLGVYAAIVPLEESYLADRFGAQYERYRQQVGRVLPTGLLPRGARCGQWRAEVILKAEVITLAFLAVMTAAVFIKLESRPTIRRPILPYGTTIVALSNARGLVGGRRAMLCSECSISQRNFELVCGDQAADAVGKRPGSAFG